MGVNKGNLSLGPCNIAYNGTDLGGTIGSVEFEAEEEVVKLLADQSGATPQKIYGRNFTGMVRVLLAEPTISAIETITGATTTASLTKMGQQTVSTAKTERVLILTPLDTATPFGNIKFPKATSRIMPGHRVFQTDHPTALMVEFEAVWDTSSSSLIQFGTADTTPPTFSSSVPANEATGIAVGGTTTLTFSETLGAGCATTNNVLMFQNNTTTFVTGTVSLSGADITLTPAANLTASTEYRVVFSGITDESGNVLATPGTIRFTTA